MTDSTGDPPEANVAAASGKAVNEREQRLREKLLRDSAQSQNLRARLATATSEVDRLRAKLARTSRQVPVPEILPGLLGRRLQAFPSTSAAAMAAARERQFAVHSSSYRKSPAVSHNDVRVELDHLAFWVPDGYAAKMKLPWALIQQVRAVTVGGTMLDIGANIGQTSIPRILLGDFQTVYAAEPEPANYARLTATVAANRVQGFVLPDRVAIGSRNGVLRLKQDHFRRHAAAADSDPDVIEVDALTLDSWIERLQIDPAEVSFVKVDTNGFELDVLRGAAGLLARGVAVWQLEVAPTFMARLNTTVGMLTDAIRANFTHFIDLSQKTEGERLRRTGELSDALAYLDTMEPSATGKPPQTDVLCLNC
jgi:FkbM family methyltransferase